MMDWRAQFLILGIASNMKTVTHVITTIERGGAENQLAILVEAQVNSGRRVNVVFLKGNPELRTTLENLGARVIDSLNGTNPILQTLRLISILKAEGFHILHCHLPRAELITTLANLKLKYPIVLSRHNSESFFPSAPSLVARGLSRFVTSRANFCVAISNAVRAFLVENREITSNCDIRVVYYGFPRTPRNSWEAPHDNKKIIGTIARLAPQKDIPTLLRAVRNLKYQTSCELLIVGDGVLKAELIELANQLDLTDTIWRGRVSDVSAELSRMDVFVLPSLYEGFGLVLLEAMNAGVPIVAARNSAIPEVLGKEYPYLFETGNDLELTEAIIKILSTERDEIAELGFKRLEYFNISKMLGSLDEIYAIAEASKCRF
jgi:glycosyltransferase involved in cell wall biosynthesis